MEGIGITVSQAIAARTSKNLNNKKSNNIIQKVKKKIKKKNK